MNEPTSGTKLMTEPTAVADYGGDLQLVARDPAEMKQAQQKLAAWFRAKMEILAGDAAELEQELAIAEKSGFRPDRFRRQARLARKRVLFYEKCALAVEAGYALVPNMPAEIFAVRTAKLRPPKKPTKHSRQRPQRSEAPAAGDGDWVDLRAYEESRKVPDGLDEEGEEKFRREYFASAFDDEIDFPVSIAKPAVMTATASAMAGNFFDEISCLPHRRNQGDPIVLGVIRDPRRMGDWDDRGISFLIAWYVDTREL